MGIKVKTIMNIGGGFIISTQTFLWFLILFKISGFRSLFFLKF